jgi:hypothetical protein
MIKVRFCNNADIIVTEKDGVKIYHQLIDTQFLDLFMPSNKEYKIVRENDKADICIVGTQHTNNDLLRDDEINIFFSVENFSAGRTHYQHLNKFGKYGNPKIDLYIYNDEVIPSEKVIPMIYMRINYFNKLNDMNRKLYYEKAREFIGKIDTPFEEKKFCLFISQNMLNPNKQIVVRMLYNLGQIDTLQSIAKTDIKLQTSNCFNSFELLKLFNKYKFIICFENSKTIGYITEKIFNVFLSKSIPIYDGDPRVSNFINKNSFIPFDDNVISKIKLINNDKNLYQNIVNREKTHTLDYQFINSNFDKLLSKKRLIK